MKSLQKSIWYAMAVLVSLCCVCSVMTIALKTTESTIAPLPVQAIDTELPINVIIDLTYSMARTQTATLEPAPLFTPTLIPAPIENTPTATVFIFPLQTSVAETNAVQITPTEYIFVTETPFLLATQQLQPTSPPSSSCEPAYPDVCITGNPRLYCKELKELGIFHFRVLPPDPLGYDKDHDGIGCE